MKHMIALFLVSMAAGAQASDWGVSGAWSIRVDPDNGNGCYAQRALDGEIIVRIGYVPDRQGGFFAAYSPLWSGLREGTFGTVEFDFGDAVFEGQAVVQDDSGMMGGYAFFDNPAFAEEFSRRKSVTVTAPSGASIEVDLTGTLKALDVIRACQAAQPADQ